MYRLIANSRATISSTAIFFSQQSRQYFSSPRGSETSLAPHSAQRDLTTVLRDISPNCNSESGARLQSGFSLERRRVHPGRVLLHHPSSRELRRDRADRLLHRRDPAVRYVRAVAIVKGRDDLFLEQTVEGVRIRRVDRLGIVDRPAAVDDP